MAPLSLFTDGLMFLSGGHCALKSSVSIATGTDLKLSTLRKMLRKQERYLYGEEAKNQFNGVRASTIPDTVYSRCSLNVGRLGGMMVMQIGSYLRFCAKIGFIP